MNLEVDGAELIPFRFKRWPEARGYLNDQPTHGSYHITGVESPNYAGYTPQQVLRTPGLLDLFNDQRILTRVEEFLGHLPVLYSVNAWWSFMATEPAGPYSQHFHRDVDASTPFLTLFLYLTDVFVDGGPHQLMLGSQVDGVEREIFSCPGLAGTMWLVNTLALHRGLLPKNRNRLVCWARYGDGPNRNSLDVYGVGPQPRSELPTSMTGTPRERYINRLVVDFDK